MVARNDRDGDGRFRRGHAGGPGRPKGSVAKAGLLREAMLNAVTADDLHGIIRALVEAAKGGDVAAARELLNRLLGRAASALPDAEPQSQPSPIDDFYD